MAKKPQPAWYPQQNVAQALPNAGGSSYFQDNYADTWNSLLQGMQSGKQSGDLYQGILESYKSSQPLDQFMHEARPWLATSYASGDPYKFITGGYKDSQLYKDVTDYKGREARDKSQMMQAYGTGRGEIAAGQRMGQQMGEQRLGRMGLGRSAARAGLASRVAAQGGSAGANLYSQLYQDHMSRSQGYLDRAVDVEGGYAERALDAARGMSAMFADAVPAPRQKEQGAGVTDFIGAAGSLAGGIGALAGGGGISSLFGAATAAKK